MVTICCLLLGVFFAAESRGQALPNDAVSCSALVEQVPPGFVNWSEGVLTATGKGMPPEQTRGSAQEREQALARAVDNARAALFAAAGQIRIEAHSRVRDLLEENAPVRQELQDMVQKAQVVHQEYSTDGTVTVRVHMRLAGAFLQLVLPPRVQQIESVRSVGAPVDASGGQDDQQVMDSSAAAYTGLVVDARGIYVSPRLVPRICDEKGQEVFGAAFASREFAVQNGMSGYLADLEGAARHSRVADHPLVVKGLRTGGEKGTAIVISNTDAARLRGGVENLSFLRRCRVLIVMDAASGGEET